MVITSGDVDIRARDGSSIRAFVAAPVASGRYPGIIFYSDIFQLTGTMLRSCARLAGHGFVVAAPEIYRRIEPPGEAFAFDDAGRERGLKDAERTTVAEFDSDCRAVLDYLQAHPAVAQGAVGAAGFCIGGHLAFRAALQNDVRATVCFYGTGIHNGKLGADLDAGSLQRASEIDGELMLIWGTLDPHIPLEGREKIAAALRKASVKFVERHYDSEHAFMRDEGPRYDAEATDGAFREMVEFLNRVMTKGSQNRLRF